MQSLDQVHTVAKEIVKLLTEKNHKIKDYFFHPELWKTLQNYESRMMVHVIKTLVNTGEAILSWYDGALTATRLKRERKSLMLEAKAD